MRSHNHLVYVITLISLICYPFGAYAYVGPGAGLTAIGTILSLIAAFFLAIVGFIWYPVRRIIRRRKQSNAQESDDAQDPQSSTSHGK